MKRIALLWILIVMAVSGYAQVKWNVRGGIGYADFLGMSNERSLTAWKIGAGVDVPLSRRWSVEPALMYAARGAKFDGYYGWEQILPATFTNRLHYLQLPLTFNFHIFIGKDAALILKAGGYAAYGLSGKAGVKVEGTDYQETFSGNRFASGCDYNEMAYDKSNHLLHSSAFHRFDAGLVTGIDFHYRRFIIGIDCNWGLTTVGEPPYENDISGLFSSLMTLNPNMTNASYGLTIGYILNEGL